MKAGILITNIKLRYKIIKKLGAIVQLTLLTSCFILTITKAKAQYADTTLRHGPDHSFWQNSLVKKTTIPAIMFGATALSWPYREEIREVRNRFIPTFRYYYDDYLQYAPAATMVALKAFNVKGRSSPKRAFVSYAFSMGIMGAVVNGVKYTARVERPDASSRNSFPSGHTAMAFMNAAVLDKEYGQYGYPLLGVGGYAMATATGLGRGLNNRHWVGDMLAGAGIGILSTEVGYYLADQIFKNRGMNEPLKNNPIPISNKPSFVELHLGYASAISKDLGSTTRNFHAKRGFNLGFEGAWFMNKYVGLGGELAFTSFPVHPENLILDDHLLAISDDIFTQALGVKYLNAGPYFSYPLPNNWFITAKINAGISSGSRGNIILQLKEEYEAEYDRTEVPVLKYKPRSALSWTTGLGIQKRVGHNTAIKAYTTYFNSAHKFKFNVLQGFDNEDNPVYRELPVSKSKTKFNHLTFGLGVTAFLW
nr:phosphatase PAP2 family protein [Pedobacter panaciterrae]